MGLFDLIPEQESEDQEVTPSFAKVILDAIDAKLFDANFATPAKIISYDHKKGLVNVQPCLKKKYPDGRVVDPPVIYNVPIQMPRSGASWIHIPVKKGDYVQLTFQDRSIDKWISSGGFLHPEDVRKHDASDAVATPGLYPSNEPMDIKNPDDLVIKNGSMEINVKENGKIEIKNGSNEFFSTLNDFAEAVRSVAQVVASEHPAGSGPLGQLVAVIERLKTFAVA